MDTDATKYQTLIRILDAIRNEATGTKWDQQYAVNSTVDEDIEQARAKAYIHLYLKVMFGLASFAEREPCITDGSYDGGIDGYFIDRDRREIYLIQSKFRRTAENFEQKEIDPREILVMEIDRITSGFTTNEDGVDYNGKIQGLIRNISKLPDAARYRYRVAIIANCTMPASHLRKLTGGHIAEVFDFKRSYNELVFPILSGTYFRANDVMIQIDLQNKSAGAKTSYSVTTTDYECEITVIFLPTLEIAKIIDKYRNTILEHNPRSYLEFEGQAVNSSIRATLLKPDSNEFALMNNGLTILSSETNINERIGQHNKAQLRILNPQIINGGQTAYTLGRAMIEDRETAEERFAGKEVLTKIITLTPKKPEVDTLVERSRLIREISEATNRQSPVVNADRLANDPNYLKIQRVLYQKYGILYERKRGEFSDGVVSCYIKDAEVLERNLFLRIFLSALGKLEAARRRKIFSSHDLAMDDLLDEEKLDRFFDAYQLFKRLAPRNTNAPKKYRDVLAKVYICTEKTAKESTLEDRISEGARLWGKLLELVAMKREKYVTQVLERRTGRQGEAFALDAWMTGKDFERDVRSFVSLGDISEEGIQRRDRGKRPAVAMAEQLPQA
ncbi:AIPR family protein [Rhizobium leguminosarum]|uniref:AIPR family protein n=1 Tax=Rhizobium leguminosarum TaxID=384 RepID=UPI001039E853|nr:AIPR family protein [Rhizobium leguminosarum]TBZ19012.1 AIPR protein [Rhizobium leguminosarum bv. viciae]